METVVMEDQIVDWVIEHCKVREEPSTFEAVMNKDQNDDSEDAA